MMILAGMHMHHAVGGWPIMVAVGAFALVIACAAVVLLARRPQSAAEGAGAAGRFGSYAPYPGGSGTAIAGDIHDQEGPEDTSEFDGRILDMLRQKGEPMPQGEVAANLGMDPDALGSWLAGMERREMLRRTWNPKYSTYMVHLPAEG